MPVPVRARAGKLLSHMYRGTRGRRYSAVMLNFNVLLYLLLQVILTLT